MLAGKCWLTNSRSESVFVEEKSQRLAAKIVLRLISRTMSSETALYDISGSYARIVRRASGERESPALITCSLNTGSCVARRHLCAEIGNVNSTDSLRRATPQELRCLVGST